MDRRTFLKTSVAGAVAGLSMGGLKSFAADAAPGKAVLKLCSQESRLPGKSLKEKVDNLLKFGGVGMEFGALNMERAKQIKDELKGTGCGVAALCWGYFTVIDPDAAKRKEAAEKLKAALDVAAEVGSTGVIMVPAFNKHPQLEGEEGFKAIVDILPAVGEHAVKVGNRILLEPLNKGEAHFMNRLEQAVRICEAVKSPGICMMGDFYHMCKEEKDDEQAFITAGKWLHHVHLASRVRNLPGQDQLKEPDKPERSFVAGFRGLKKIGYQDYCSLECGVHKGTDPMVEIPKSFAMLKKQWEEAVV